jgi:hypothetical protein
MSRTSGYKLGRDPSKPYAPTGKELSEAIGLVLKDVSACEKNVMFQLWNACDGCSRLEGISLGVIPFIMPVVLEFFRSILMIHFIVSTQYEGPVDTSIVTKKLQDKHPKWKLPERRVNKFVKRFMSKHKNPAGADDDQTASMYKQTSSKRGFLGIFSPSKRNILVATDPEVIPEQEPAEQEIPVPEEKPASPVKEETPPSPEKEVAEATSKDIAYETDNSVVDGSQDCWGLSCSVM